MSSPTANGALAESILDICDKMARDCDGLHFGAPVEFVYNPLVYARQPFKRYVELFVRDSGTILFLGMNPGPFGMAQTGIPFGDIPHVRDWMGIREPVEQPPKSHPKRPIQGFDCHRVEGSGQRLWGYFSSLFANPTDFFQRCSVFNYCPLVFMDQGGANITPDKLARGQREDLFAICDQALAKIIVLLQPRALIGIGGFARQRLDLVAGLAGPAIAGLPRVTLTHPSPANPRANQGWNDSVRSSLTAAGLWPL